ncbi:MAG: hypothetical protein ACTSUT_10950 [Promethearchaeota archaeon]
MKVLERNNDSNIDKSQVDWTKLNKELKQKKQEIMKDLNPSDLKDVFTDAVFEAGDVLGDVFYNSVKSFFDVGFKLAKNLNFDSLIDSIKKAQEDQKDKKKE